MNPQKYFLLLFTLISIPFCNYALGYTNLPDTSKPSMKIVVVDCPKIASVDSIIEIAISVGAPTYNEGNHIGCYMIYEGAAYKILHKYGTQCAQVSDILKTALEKSYTSYTSAEKAWIMREAFDKILGEPTIKK